MVSRLEVPCRADLDLAMRNQVLGSSRRFNRSMSVLHGFGLFAEPLATSSTERTIAHSGVAFGFVDWIQVSTVDILGD